MRFFGVSLGEGNSKVGEVLTFSLPSATTCPGASPWCLKHCYAHRYERIRPKSRKAYQNNLVLANDTERFTRTMIGILPRIMPCMRIHVAGDFHSRSYVDAWRKICTSLPETYFWSYTRSWSNTQLLEKLEKLRRLQNVQLFASVDSTMPNPPKNWRVAYIQTDSRANGLLCSEQVGNEESCQTCGYCFHRRQGNVVFKVH